MCDRYFVVFPNKAKPEPVAILNRALRSLKSEDVKLHPDRFLKPIYPRESKLPEFKARSTMSKQNRDQILRQNVFDISKRTRNFGLLLTQFHWVGLLTLEQGRIVMSQTDDTLRAISMYGMLLKRGAQSFQKFLNALHMTGNHEIANLVEGWQSHCGFSYPGTEDKSADRRNRGSSSKKRKGSADSGFCEEDEVTDSTKHKKTSFHSSSTAYPNNPAEEDGDSCDRRNVNRYKNVHKFSAIAFRDEGSDPSSSENLSFIRNKKEALSSNRNKLHKKENRLSKFFSIFRS